MKKTAIIPKTELVIITGLSGSGKGTVLKALEDLGYYSVDNLPIELIPKFAQLTKDAPTIRRAALVVDIREGSALERFPSLFKRIRRMVPTRLIFLEADESSLIRRFSETRRPHPLGTAQSVSASIRREREQLEPIRKLADPIINTTKFNVHELRETIPAFKNYSGKHPSVARYIRSFPQTTEFIERISELLIYLLPHYIAEGKSYLTISFGCTGGHHRSVLIASEIRKRLAAAGYRIKETHRDVKKV